MLIIRTVSRWLHPLFLVFSVYLLLRGHNGPGGGFVGGLVAAVPFSLHALVYDAASARRLLRIDPHVLMGLGLLSALSSGLVAFFVDQPFLTGIWKGALGTPLLFDIGVYSAVMGVTLMIVLSLAEEA
jgi:multicomponent Na+:H+ antiporter subunit B